MSAYGYIVEQLGPKADASAEVLGTSLGWPCFPAIRAASRGRNGNRRSEGLRLTDGGELASCTGTATGRCDPAGARASAAAPLWASAGFRQRRHSPQLRHRGQHRCVQRRPCSCQHPSRAGRPSWRTRRPRIRPRPLRRDGSRVSGAGRAKPSHRPLRPRGQPAECLRRLLADRVQPAPAMRHRRTREFRVTGLDRGERQFQMLLRDQSAESHAVPLSHRSLRRGAWRPTPTWRGVRPAAGPADPDR